MSRLRQFMLACVMLGVPFASHAADNATATSNLVAQANQMQKAFLAKDFEAYTAFLYSSPVMWKIVGGTQKEFIADLKNTFLDMEQQKDTLESITLGTPSELISSGKTLQGLVSEKFIMKLHNGQLAYDNYLLAISEDNGKNWHFIETSHLSKHDLKEIFPDYNEKFAIPKTTPIFTPNP